MKKLALAAAAMTFAAVSLVMPATSARAASPVTCPDTCDYPSNGGGGGFCLPLYGADGEVDSYICA